jgi:hypothetical protein
VSLWARFEFILNHLASWLPHMMSTFRTSKSIHPKVKEVIIQLSFWLKPDEIAFYLDVHPRTVKRIWEIYKETGEVVRPSPEARGRPRSLDWTHGMVSG